MKIQTTIYKRSLLLVMTTLLLGFLHAQDSIKTSSNNSVKPLLESRNWTFKAETMYPMGGIARQLTPEYDLKVKDNILTSYLPYIGRAFSAPIDPSSSALQFTSQDYEYSLKSGKKGRWNLLIKPKDNSDIRQLFFTIFENGKANLQVNSNSRQSISYSGYIEGIAKKE